MKSLISLRKGAECSEMTYSDPEELYVSYLSTDELVASLGRLEQKLSTMRGLESSAKYRVLQQVKKDLLYAIELRQLLLGD